MLMTYIAGRERFDTPEVRKAFAGYVAQHGSSAAAHRALKADYESGKMIGGVDWRTAWAFNDEVKNLPMPETCPKNLPLPQGWSLCNLRRRYVNSVADATV